MTNGRASPPAGGRAKPTPPRAAGLHPRNRHQGRYDVDALLALAPTLARHLVRTPAGERSFDFAHPEAVRALNAALLELHYGVRHWQLPAGYLCPPVPGRADYVHGLADLLASDGGGAIPRGSAVRVLDIGTGANLVYPLIGHAEYGWRFVGSDIDAEALAIGARTLAHNPAFAHAITLRLQPQRNALFSGVVQSGERFAASLCNPPFHASAAEAAQGSARKWRNLGQPAGARSAPRLNFGGQSNELWCRGGEAGFLQRMVAESATRPDTVGWYTSLVAKAEHLAALRQQLARLGAREVREQRMAQGNKQSRFLAWSFLEAAQRAALAGSGCAVVHTTCGQPCGPDCGRPAESQTPRAAQGHWSKNDQPVESVATACRRRGSQ